MKPQVSLTISWLLAISGSAFGQEHCKIVLQPPAQKVQLKEQFHFDTKTSKTVLKLTKSAKLNQILTLATFKAFRLDPLNDVLDRITRDQSERPYFQKPADAFQLKVTPNRALQDSLARVPKTGPLIITSNHPLNGTDGIIVPSELSKIRPDVKVVLTHFLSAVPGMNDAAFFLNPYGTAEARKYNESVVNEQIIPHLKAGGAIFIFPAGEVSMKNVLDGLPFEKSWKIGTATLLSATPNAEVLPVFIADEASTTWYRIRRQAEKQKTGKGALEKAIGKLAWAVIPLIHLREIATNIGREITFGVGHSFPGSKLLKRFEEPEGLLESKGPKNFFQCNSVFNKLS